jgi:hypothetical protein
VRCVHLNEVGLQCPEQALEGKEFCPYHTRIPEDPDPEGSAWVVSDRREGTSRVPVVYRLAALILLLIFALNAYRTLRSWLGY